MGVRDHEPFIMEEFNGLWARGDAESAPSDHFIQADNVQFFNQGFETRPGINIFQNVASPIIKVLRIYNYVMQTGQSLLVLTHDGKIWHIVKPNDPPFLVLDIPLMTDFGFVAIAGRAYITPVQSEQDQNGIWHDLGMRGKFLYVYDGKRVTMARKAAGPPPVDASTTGGFKQMIAYNSAVDGTVTKGVHVIAVAFGSDPHIGPEIFAVVESPGNKQIQVENIPKAPAGTSRTLVMTKAIDPKDYKADQLTFLAGKFHTHPTMIIPTSLTNDLLTSHKINIADDTSGFDPYGIFVPPTVPPFPGPVTGGAMQVSNTDEEGHCDFGFHLVGVVFETDSGYLSAPGPQFFAGNTYVDVKRAVKVWNIPTAHVPVPPATQIIVKRHLVSTKWIPEYNGDQKGYQFFFIPKGVIENNTDTTKVVSYYDSELVSDASHLIDNFSEIPAMVNLNTYHSRLVMVGDPTFPLKEDGITGDTTKPDNRSVAWLSAPGEPEAISRVDGLIVTPLDGNPLTNCQEFRDILYLFKKTRTFAYSDNQDVPSSWQEEVLDQGVGAPIHGIATVLDSGGVNIDFLLIVDWSGLMLFNGTYARPELSWKIEDLWLKFNRNNYRHMQIINDSINKEIWITLPEPEQYIVLHADYRNGLDATNIQWSRWIFDVHVSALTLIETNKVVIGAIGNSIRV